MVAAGVRQRRGVEVGELLRQGVLELLERAGLGEEGHGRSRGPGRGRRPSSVVPVLAVTGQLLVEDGLDDVAQTQAVGRGDEVDRAAHGDAAHELAVDERLDQVVGVEIGEA